MKDKRILFKDNEFQVPRFAVSRRLDVCVCSFVGSLSRSELSKNWGTSKRREMKKYNSDHVKICGLDWPNSMLPCERGVVCTRFSRLIHNCQLNMCLEHGLVNVSHRSLVFTLM